jgi:hypothetical protein
MSSDGVSICSRFSVVKCDCAAGVEGNSDCVELDLLGVVAPLFSFTKSLHFFRCVGSLGKVWSDTPSAFVFPQFAASYSTTIAFSTFISSWHVAIYFVYIERFKICRHGRELPKLTEKQIKIDMISGKPHLHRGSAEKSG